MTTFRLLGSASCLAILLGAGAALAKDNVDTQVPIAATKLSAEDLEVYFGGGISTFNAALVAPDVTAGFTRRGIPTLNSSFSLEGSLGMHAPGSVTEMSVTSRIGFTLDDLSNIQIAGHGGLDLIGGTAAYHGGVGVVIPILPKVDIVAEARVRGPFFSAPTDFGGRLAINFYPGRNDDLDSPAPRDFSYRDPRLLWGLSATAVPSAGALVTSADFTALFDMGNRFDIGPRLSLGYQLPAGAIEASAGGEVGYSPDGPFRAYMFGQFTSIGPFVANHWGLGGDFRIAPMVLLNGELGARGGLGSLTELTLKAGIRYEYMPDWPTEAFVPKIADLGIDPYVGKSVTGIPTGGGIAIPALDFGLNLPMENGIVPGVRGQIGYQLPAGVLEGWAGGQLGFQATPRVQPFVFIDLGNIGGGFAANRVGVGTELKLDPSWGINAEASVRGGLGTFTEGAFKIGARWHPKPPEATLGFRYQW